MVWVREGEGKTGVMDWIGLKWFRIEVRSSAFGRSATGMND